MLVGNSIVRNINVPGVEKRYISGGKLCTMSEYLMGPGIKLVISGIPEIMQRDSVIVEGRMVREYEMDLEKASHLPGVILCPFYPSKSMRPEQRGIVQRTNTNICSLNANKSEGTSPIIQRLFGPDSQNGGSYFRSNKLEDDVHPSNSLANSIGLIIQQYIARRGDEDMRQALKLRG